VTAVLTTTLSYLVNAPLVVRCWHRTVQKVPEIEFSVNFRGLGSTDAAWVF